MRQDAVDGLRDNEREVQRGRCRECRSERDATVTMSMTVAVAVRVSVRVSMRHAVEALSAL
jgi:hypothetical protein